MKRFVEVVKLRRYQLYCQPLQCCLAEVLKKGEFTINNSHSDLRLNVGIAIHLCLFAEKLRKRAGIHYF